MLYDVIIVGSGPAGALSAFGLQGKNILMLDVGKVPKASEDFNGNLYDLKKQNDDLSKNLLGENFESLNNVTNEYINPKIKAPLNRYIIEDAEKLSPTKNKNFDPFFSFAKGGMANAWGAGSYRFSEGELSEFPVDFKEMENCYEEVTKHIGVNGREDDLSCYLGSAKFLQRPPPFQHISNKLYKKYTKNKKSFIGKGFKIGALRQAVLTEDLGNRKKNDYNNLDFFKPYLSAVYNPAYTVNDLIDAQKIEYKDSYLVKTFSEDSSGTHVSALNLKTSEIERFSAKKVILAAGAINTSKIVLASSNDTKTKLYLQENPISYIPMFDPFEIAKPIEKKAVPASLAMVYDAEEYDSPVFISIYGLSGPMKSEYIFDFPFSAKCNLLAAKYLTSAMIITQVFYPGEHSKDNWVKLGEDGEIEISFKNHEMGELEKKIITQFRKIGFYGHHSLCKFPTPGNSFHYACTLPMKKNPKKFETYPDGKLFGYNNVHIADSSNFTTLPSKNLTFTIMANALRISRIISKEL